MARLGLYSLKGYSKIRGTDYTGYSVDLYRINTKIATITDYGNGAEAEIYFNREGGLTSENYGFVLSEFNSLVDTLGDFPDKDALYTTFLASSYSAVTGYVELLLELRELEMLANKANKEVGDNSYYAVGIVGSSWFKKNQFYDQTIFYHDTEELDFEKANNKFTKERLEKHHKEPLVALAILNGKFNWELNYKDYKELITP